MKFVGQPCVTEGFFDGVEVAALKVFNKGKFQYLAVFGLADEDRQLADAGKLGGAPAAFSGNDFVVAAGGGPHDEGLEDALATDTFGKFGEGFWGEVFAGL